MALFSTHPDRQTLLEEKILSVWGLVVPQGAGHGEKFLDEVERELTKFELPQTTIKRQEFESRTAAGKKGAAFPVCLYVEHEMGTGFKAYFTAHDWGKHLLLSHIDAGEISKSAGVFQRKMVQAYLGFLNAARDAAVERFAKELNLDLSKVAAQSKGIVDIA